MCTKYTSVMEAPRRRRPLVALLTANVISVLGGAMSLVALPWFVFDTTGSAGLTGIAAVCETAPVVLMSIVAGSVVARVGARHTRGWSDLVAGVAVLSIPVLHATGGVAYWQVLVLVGVNGALRTPAVAASLVLLREVTALAGLRDEQTSGAYAASVRLASTLGAPTAGALIAVIGAPGVLAVDAATFLISAVTVWGLIPAHPSARRDSGSRRDPERRSRPTDGFTVLRNDPLLLTLSGIAVAFAVTSAGWASVAAPIYGQTVLRSPLQLGVVLGTFGAGALIGNLTYARLARHLSRYTILATALLLSGPALWTGLGLQAPLPVLLPLMAAAGLSVGLLPPLYLTLQYRRVPRPQQGHLFGLTFGMETAGQTIGAALIGFVLTYTSLTATLLGMGAATAVFTAAVLRATPLQQLRQPPNQDQGTTQLTDKTQHSHREGFRSAS
jgi:predicted MFS family arabinose efflux permease